MGASFTALFEGCLSIYLSWTPLLATQMLASWDQVSALFNNESIMLDRSECSVKCILLLHGCIIQLGKEWFWPQHRCDDGMILSHKKITIWNTQGNKMIRDKVEPCLSGVLKGEAVGNCYSLGTELILQDQKSSGNWFPISVNALNATEVYSWKCLEWYIFCIFDYDWK